MPLLRRCTVFLFWPKWYLPPSSLHILLIFCVVRNVNVCKILLSFLNWNSAEGKWWRWKCKFDFFLLLTTQCLKKYFRRTYCFNPRYTVPLLINWKWINQPCKTCSFFAYFVIFWCHTVHSTHEQSHHVVTMMVLYT